MQLAHEFSSNQMPKAYPIMTLGSNLTPRKGTEIGVYSVKKSYPAITLGEGGPMLHSTILAVLEGTRMQRWQDGQLVTLTSAFLNYPYGVKDLVAEQLVMHNPHVLVQPQVFGISYEPEMADSLILVVRAMLGPQNFITGDWLDLYSPKPRTSYFPLLQREFTARKIDHFSREEALEWLKQHGEIDSTVSVQLRLGQFFVAHYDQFPGEILAGGYESEPPKKGWNYVFHLQRGKWFRFFNNTGNTQFFYVRWTGEKLEVISEEKRFELGAEAEE